jgi:hypothetical protein
MFSVNKEHMERVKGYIAALMEGSMQFSIS